MFLFLLLLYPYILNNNLFFIFLINIFTINKTKNTHREPCHLDCGTEGGYCDNSDTIGGQSRCLCPFSKTGVKCEEGKSRLDFICCKNESQEKTQTSFIFYFLGWFLTYLKHFFIIIIITFVLNNFLYKIFIV